MAAGKRGFIPPHPSGGGGFVGGHGEESGRGGNPRVDHPMFDFRTAGAISIKTLPKFKEVFKQPIGHCRGGIIICSVTSNINTNNFALGDTDWNIYYAELNIVGYLGGARSVLMRSATGQNNGQNFFTITNAHPLIEDPFAGPVVYRWSVEDGETWDEIAVEAREMTMGAAATPTFTGGFVSHPELLTLDLYVIGRTW